MHLIFIVTLQVRVHDPHFFGWEMETQKVSHHTIMPGLGLGDPDSTADVLATISGCLLTHVNKVGKNLV